MVMRNAGDKNLYIVDRSGADTDDTCGMRYWYNRIEGGKGIVPKDEPLALRVGKETHNDLQVIGDMNDIRAGVLKELIEDLLCDITDEDKIYRDKMELLYRRLGWMVAWALFVEPQIRVKYITRAIEHEIVLDRDPLWVAVTPDRVIEERKSGQLVYLEYKTTVSASQKWLGSWPYAIQMHTSLAAVQEELKKSVSYAQVVGLMKGYQSTSDGRLLHPYVWAYYNASKNEWSHSYEKSRGSEWTPMPVWEYPGGIVEWVQLLGDEVAKSQFPFAPPVFLNPRMLDEWIQRRLLRERNIDCVKSLCVDNEELRGVYFERRTKNCRPPFGDACPYLPLCWNAQANLKPMEHPDFVVREPHHDLETIDLE